MKMHKRFFFNSLFIYFLLVAGCNSTYATSKPTKVTQVTNTPSVPPSPIPSDTLAPKPTHVPMSTLAYDLQDQLYAVLKNNGNCDLPCFLGITPGITTWAEAKTFLEQYSMNKPIKYDESTATITNKQYSAQIQTNKDIDLLILLTLDVNENDLVTHIDFYVSTYHDSSLAFDDQHLSRYSLREMFQRQGPPDQVYLLPPERGVYGIQLVYEKLKMAMDLTGRAKEFAGGEYEICPGLGDGDISTMEIALASSTDPIDVKTLIGYPFWKGSQSLEEVGGMRVDDFYRLITGDQQPACFHVQ